MYWKFDKKFELLSSLATYGKTAPSRNARCNSWRKSGLLCGGGAIFHSREIKLSRSTAGNYDAVVRLTRSRTAQAIFFRVRFRNFDRPPNATQDYPRGSYLIAT